MINVEGVKKTYGGRAVLRGMDFSVRAGEFVSLVGPSGVGKTTLINGLLAAETMDEGRLSVNGVDVGGLRGGQVQKFRRGVGVVFQDYKLLERETVFENVALALNVGKKMPADEISTRVSDVLRLVGLEGHRNHFPDQLSGGEKQRCAIARALVHSPELLIADEPTGNLDGENSLELAKLLAKINKSGTTVLLSTHDKAVVDMLGKRVVRMDEGKVLWDKKACGYDG